MLHNVVKNAGNQFILLSLCFYFSAICMVWSQFKIWPFLYGAKIFDRREKSRISKCFLFDQCFATWYLLCKTRCLAPVSTGLLQFWSSYSILNVEIHHFCSIRHSWNFASIKPRLKWNCLNCEVSHFASAGSIEVILHGTHLYLQNAIISILFFAGGSIMRHFASHYCLYASISVLFQAHVHLTTFELVENLNIFVWGSSTVGGKSQNFKVFRFQSNFTWSKDPDKMW
jgi:hypothetical protein